MFPPVYSPEDLEKEVFRFWQDHNIYRKVKEKGGREFFFVDGPPYTTGEIHLGTAWNKVIKDVVLRYKRMTGYRVIDTPGWDMHGLPIEVKVEQMLGFKNKRDIEKFGVDKFIAKCMEYAVKNKEKMTEQFKRLAVWMDWEKPYMTVKADYINAAWWTVRKAHEKGLLERKLRVVNWCPRCETALAEAEVEYWDETDPSIYVKFPIKGEENTYIVIWTTTPWTLPANMAVAVHPDYIYVKAKVREKSGEGGEEVIVVARDLLEEVVKKGNQEVVEILEEIKGRELEGIEYEHPLSDEVPYHKGKTHKICLANFVAAENTGCVHIAPGHGADDFYLGVEYGLEVFNPVNDSGVYTEQAGKYAGMNVRDANKVIIEDLKQKRFLFAEEKITHRYGHCWRCKSPIIYRATEQWFIAVSKVKDTMLEEIERVNWVPEWAGLSRFKDWVSNARDWCISRQRYWGIPIPVWMCEKCSKIKVIGSVDELGIEIENDMDVHRPKVDMITFKCECGGVMKRVPDVFDVWFDSGVASWATLNFPRVKDDFERLWPADFITEGHDQTRGWFYSQLGASVVSFGKAPYRTVLMHGFTLDEYGRKMSKSLGNVIKPEEVVEWIGVDAFRLYVLSSALWEDLRFSREEAEMFRRYLNIVWNAVRFAYIYMSLDKDDFIEACRRGITFRIEDRWILSRLENFCKIAKDALESYNLHKTVKSFVNFFIEDFSRWYLQLIRSRVWEEKANPSKMAAYATVLKVIDKSIRILSPYIPVLAEWIYQHFLKELSEAKELLCESHIKESIFMEEFPEVEEELIDRELENAMEVAKEIFEATSNARQKAKRKLRWPLKLLVVEGGESVKRAVEMLEEIIKTQCNVKEVRYTDKFEKKVRASVNYREAGPILKDRIKAFAEFVSGLKEDEINRFIEEGEVEFGGEKLPVSLLNIKYELPEGYVDAEFSCGRIYLYTKMDEDLWRECLAREIVRRIQEMRKELDMNVEDFINVALNCDESIVKGWHDYIVREVRAKNVTFNYSFESEEDWYIREWNVEGKKIVIGIRKA
jgi:isoleucyl-tRNA synthetase